MSAGNDAAARLPHDHWLIGLVGPAGAGKDTAAHYLGARHQFVDDAFASPIRNLVLTLTEHAGPAFTSSSMGSLWCVDRELKEQAMPIIGHSYRRLAQTLGTEWGRALDKDLWIRLLAARLGLDALPVSEPVHDRIVITDVRFHNEAEWIRRLGGRIVRIVRDTRPVHPHESEAHLGHITSWRRVDNTGTLEQLHAGLDAMVEELQQLSPSA